MYRKLPWNLIFISDMTKQNAHEALPLKASRFCRSYSLQNVTKIFIWEFYWHVTFFKNISQRSGSHFEESSQKIWHFLRVSKTPFELFFSVAFREWTDCCAFSLWPLLPFEPFFCSIEKIRSLVRNFKPYYKNTQNKFRNCYVLVLHLKKDWPFSTRSNHTWETMCGGIFLVDRTWTYASATLTSFPGNNNACSH